MEYDMRDENGDLQIPQFKSDIPEHLVHGLTPKEKWQYEQISIQSQQNSWLILRCLKVDKRQNEMETKFEAMEKRIAALEDLKKMMTAKWTIIASVFSVIIIPAALVILGAWLEHLFGKK